VERIEIVKGPVSSVYGSAAMAGVINIITRQPGATTRKSLRATLGSHTYGSTALKTSMPFKDGWLSVGASFVDEGEQIERAKYIGKSFNTTAKIKLGSFTQIVASSRLSESKSQSYPDASGGAKFAISSAVEYRSKNHRQLSVSLKHKFANKNIFRIETSIVTTRNR